MSAIFYSFYRKTKQLEKRLDTESSLKKIFLELLFL